MRNVARVCVCLVSIPLAFDQRINRYASRTRGTAHTYLLTLDRNLLHIISCLIENNTKKSTTLRALRWSGKKCERGKRRSYWLRYECRKESLKRARSVQSAHPFRCRLPGLSSGCVCCSAPLRHTWLLLLLLLDELTKQIIEMWVCAEQWQSLCIVDV